MKFCPVCDNMLYEQLSTEGMLLNVCKNCGSSVRIDTSATASCVMENNYADDSTLYKQFMNRHMHDDPTLPRVSNIACVNATCTKTADESNDVVYVKYDAINVKFLYQCGHCATFWKSV